ncbi:hypothetical protein V2J09_020528 [Rumex salicifolius]
MYTTMPLHGYEKPHCDSSRPIREEPNSGCLLLQDDQEDGIKTASSCFLSRQDLMIKTLPFPHNALLTIEEMIIAIPFSSFLEALRCAKLEDEQSCCFCFTVIPDADPRPLDHEDIYQQFKISPSKTCRGYFSATCVASDGVVPKFLRNNFQVKSTTKGLDSSIRNHLPNTKFPSSALTIGKWSCPFMFIKDIPTKNQVKQLFFYEMTLERRWEKIFTCENRHGIPKRSVDMDVVISTEWIRVGGKEVEQFEEDFVDGFVWFKGISANGDELPSVGLSSVIMERMIWEQERIGWVRRDEKKMKMVRREEFGGEGLWLSFDCFVLVERFALKRLDGSLVLEYDFKHTNQGKIKWG